MRTIVEMRPEHHDALLALAAQRGEKDLSDVLSEAIESYLENEAASRRAALLELQGMVDPADAEELRRKTAAIRGSWR
jgi:hypothetical protein